MRKRTGKLCSVFSGLITQYVEYKQNIGCKTTVMEFMLKRFDKFANDRNEKALGISKDLADAWCCKFSGESEENRYYRIVILRGFSSFLQIIGYNSYIPILPKHQSNFTPYIYTSDEIESRVKERADDYITDIARGTIQGYTSVSVIGNNVSMRLKNNEYALLPVWMLNFRFKNKEFHFYLNGQTGKIVADRPISAVKVAAYGVIIFVVVLIITMIGGLLFI